VLWCLELGGTSEREYSEKVKKIKEKIMKTEKDVKNDFAKIEKIKLDALKKTEDMRRSAESDLEKIEKDILKSQDLASESKQRLSSEIALLKSEIENRYTEMKTRISKAIEPKYA
jgi:NAD+--asparagine ADP-ribosyltransferase